MLLHEMQTRIYDILLSMIFSFKRPALLIMTCWSSRRKCEYASKTQEKMEERHSLNKQGIT